ncbi:MAG: hypothetical protein ACRD0H_31500 [Actinomycetes bacterium]
MSVPGESGPSIAADPDDELDACPSCGETSGVQVITDIPPKVRAWSCKACGTEWWISVISPHPRPWLDGLAEEVAARAVLRDVIALREQADTLTRAQLRARLIGCLARLDQICRCSAASEFPAGHRPDNGVPGAHPVPHPPVVGTSG